MKTLVKKDGMFPSLESKSINNFFDDFITKDLFDWTDRNFAALGSNLPSVNLKETDTEIEVELAAPGKVKEDFNIEIDHNVLTISSEEKTEKEEKDNQGKYTRREFSYASFRRAFTLPESVNTDSINASYENGVLHVTLPKRIEALPKPKRLIEIA